MNAGISKQGKRVGMWIRVSTEDQALGESPEHHAIRAKQYAEFQGWTVVETYDLAGVSGKSVWDHPECQRMLRDVKRGHIQGLLFSKLARLARNTRELLDFAELFENSRATLVSIEEKIDTSTPAGLLFYTMLGAIAQWEREEIGARLKSSIAVRAKLGKPLSGTAPFGYRWEDRKLVIIPEEAEIRKLAFKLFFEHGRKGTVATHLNKLGYRTRNGNKFKDMQIYRMLSCPSAMGSYRINMYRNSKGKKADRILKPESEWGYAPCEPIISESEFLRASRMMEERKKPERKPGKKPVHLFAGVARCGCGQRMYVYTRSPNYSCIKCKNRIGVQALEEIFLDCIGQNVADTGKVYAQIEKAKRKVAELKATSDKIRKEVDLIKAEMKKVYDLYIAGGIDTERFKTLNTPLEERLAEYTQQLARTEGETSATEVSELNAEVIAAEGRSIINVWPDLDLDGKLRLVSLLCSEIRIPHDDPEAPVEVTLNTRLENR
jgi:site-specific DNA recombinase